jgi:hypothetical protein
MYMATVAAFALCLDFRMIKNDSPIILTNAVASQLGVHADERRCGLSGRAMHSPTNRIQRPDVGRPTPRRTSGFIAFGGRHIGLSHKRAPPRT